MADGDVRVALARVPPAVFADHADSVEATGLIDQHGDADLADGRVVQDHLEQGQAPLLLPSVRALESNWRITT